MFAPFRKGKQSKGKESYFANIGESILSTEPDCQLDVDSAKNDDFLVLSRYVEVYAPATVADEESPSGVKPIDETASSTRGYNTAVMSPLHSGSQDQQDHTGKSISSPESDISASEPDNGSDNNYVETDLKQYAEYDVTDRTGTSLENKETYENDLDGFTNLEVNAPDEVAEYKGISTVDNNNSPVTEHKDDYVKAILFTEEEFMGTLDDSEIGAENEYYSASANENDAQEVEASSQEKLFQAYTENESKSSLEVPSSKPSAKSLLRNDVSSFKEENQHPNAPLPPPAHMLKDKLLAQQQSPRGGQNDRRFETSRTSTLPIGLISPPQPPVRTVMEYSYVTNNGNGNQLNNNSNNRMHQMSSSGSTTNRLPSYTRKAPAPFTIYDESHDGGGLGSGYRLNSHGSSNGSDTSRSRDSFFSYSEDSNTSRSRDSFFSYGSLSPKSGVGGYNGPSPRNQAALDHRNDFRGGRMPMPMPPSSSMAGIAAGQEEKEENEEDEEFVTYLFSKVRHNRIEIVQDILSKGSRRTSRLRDDNGNSLLHVCAQNNLRKMASLVLSFGCEINAINYKACTALDYAERYSFSKLADWLRSKGALRAEAIQ